MVLLQQMQEKLLVLQARPQKVEVDNLFWQRRKGKSLATLACRIQFTVNFGIVFG